MKKVVKTTRPFRYDLNQIPYDYTVEVRNRFKGLDLIECQKNYGWRFVTLYRRQGARPSKWLSEEALQIAVNRREAKGKGEKERYTHLNAEFQRIAGEIRKPSSVISVLEKEMATHSSVLAWRIPGTVEPSGLPSMGSHRVRHD